MGPRRTIQKTPAWFGSPQPWREPAPPRSPRRRVRRHAAPAIVALLVASGIGLAWPGDLRLVSIQRSGTAAEASPRPLPTEAPIASPPVAVVAAAPMAAPEGNPIRRRAQTWEAPPPPSMLDGYVWPLAHGRITDPFGPSPWGSRIVNGHLFHDGIDIATYCGDRIVAAHQGIVLAAGRKFDAVIGWVGDLGPYLARLDAKQIWSSLPITVVIDDGNGYRSIYAHFYRVAVRSGQRVRAGQFLGYEGATGRASGCHLHYGLFAPHEPGTFAIEPSIVKRMLVPPLQIARIDPLLVLPRRSGDLEPNAVVVPGSGHGLRE
jgi:murein DD-endopeptidase MepM/ murein hydrolase activator NlpD